jgi:hypothetical protein
MRREDLYEMWLLDILKSARWWLELPATVLRLCLFPPHRIASGS